MNATPLAVAALIVGAVFFSPAPAYADDPELEPWTAEMQGEPWLDCDVAMWYVPVTHYFAEQTAPDVYADPTITTTIEEWGAATGDSAEADCPNWVTDADGNWYNAGTTSPDTTSEVYPPALPLDPLPSVEVDLGKAGIEAVWKVGLER